MNDGNVQDVIQKMQETYDAGKPLIEEFNKRWQDEVGLLHAIHFMVSVADMPVDQKNAYRNTLKQIIADMDALFAALQIYSGLTLAVKSILQDYHAHEREDIPG